jgi:hypothetical protein
MAKLIDPDPIEGSERPRGTHASPVPHERAEFTRECIGDEIGRSIRAIDVEQLLDGAAAERGFPEHIRMDNGPEFIADAIKPWCIRNAPQRVTSIPAARGRTRTSRA